MDFKIKNGIRVALYRRSAYIALLYRYMGAPTNISRASINFLCKHENIVDNSTTLPKNKDLNLHSKGATMRKWLFLFLFYFINTATGASPLPASDVFKLSLARIDPNSFTITWVIKPQHFIYSTRIQLNAHSDANLTLGALRLPAPVYKTDKLGRKYPIYRNKLILPISVLGQSPGETVLDLQYQGCSDAGFCYPPEKRAIKVTIDTQLALANLSIEKPHTPTVHNAIVDIFTNPNWFMIILSFYGLGLFLTFTPCVLPMIPVLSGIIVGSGKTPSTRRSFLISLSYVFGMSITYAIVGATIALAGSNLQIAMQSPWVISAFAAIFVILALSMFGYFDLKLPVSWQAYFAAKSRAHANGHYIGAAIMGALSTLILSPCVSPPLIGVLTYIANTGNILMGSSALFFLGLGMGTPLLLIGASAGKWLPKAGLWMNTIKAFFGVLLLAVAIFLLSRILPAIIVMTIWGALLIFTGLYSGAFTKAKSTFDKFCQGIGIIFVVYGLLILVGASAGGTNPLQPLAIFHSSATTSSNLQFKPVHTVAETLDAIKAAQGKPVILDFYADWCVSCQVMEATTFKDPQLIKKLQNFVILKADVTNNNADTTALMQYFKIIAPPTFLFFDKDGQALTSKTLVGEISAEKFLQSL